MHFLRVVDSQHQWSGSKATEGDPEAGLCPHLISDMTFKSWSITFAWSLASPDGSITWVSKLPFMSKLISVRWTETFLLRMFSRWCRSPTPGWTRAGASSGSMSRPAAVGAPAYYLALQLRGKKDRPICALNTVLGWGSRRDSDIFQVRGDETHRQEIVFNILSYSIFLIYPKLCMYLITVFRNWCIGFYYLLGRDFICKCSTENPFSIVFLGN